MLFAWLVTLPSMLFTRLVSCVLNSATSAIRTSRIKMISTTVTPSSSSKKARSSPLASPPSSLLLLSTVLLVEFHGSGTASFAARTGESFFDVERITINPYLPQPGIIHESVYGFFVQNIKPKRKAARRGPTSMRQRNSAYSCYRQSLFFIAHYP